MNPSESNPNPAEFALMMLVTLFIALGTALAAPETAPTEPLTVMSFNVRYGTANDGPDAWELRKDFLVETIAKHAPAILGTQECLDFQAEYMATHLPGYAWIGLGREEDGGGEMTAILYQKVLLLPLETGHFWLSDSPGTPGSKSWDSSLPRIATWVKFHHRPTGRQFYYYNTHLDHRGAQARLESARLIAARMASLHLGEPVILTGDFNAAGGSSEPWKALIDGGLTDLWESAQERKGEANTWNGFNIPAPAEHRRIDWIFATPGVTALTCEIDAIQKDGRFPSDHMPVIARILLPAEG